MSLILDDDDPAAVFWAVVVLAVAIVGWFLGVFCPAP
jgi:hypothetical protein